MVHSSPNPVTPAVEHQEGNLTLHSALTKGATAYIGLVWVWIGRGTTGYTRGAFKGASAAADGGVEGDSGTRAPLRRPFRIDMWSWGSQGQPGPHTATTASTATAARAAAVNAFIVAPGLPARGAGPRVPAPSAGSGRDLRWGSQPVQHARLRG